MKTINYNTTNQSWHDIANKDNIWVKWRFETLKNLIKNNKIDLKKENICLDVGCGSNDFALHFENISNFSIDQTDVDPKNLKNKKKGKGSLFVYDINNKDIKLKDKYDIIFLLDVLEHIDNDKEFLESCYFHLKDGGFLIVNVPSIPELFSKYDIAVGHRRRYSMKKLKILILESNFKIISMKYWGFFLIPLLFLRKIMLNFSKKKDEEIIKKGMDTQPKIVLLIINFLKFLEMNIIKISILGSSIITIIKK